MGSRVHYLVIFCSASAGEPTSDSSAASREVPVPPAGASAKLANRDGTEQNGAATARGCRESGANVCVRIKGAVGGENGNRLLLCERWSVVQIFASTSLAELVIGVFTRWETDSIQALSLSLIEGKPHSEWKKLTKPSSPCR